MKLIFIGTRGEVESRTRWHRMHTSLLIRHRGRRIMIDCGLDWLGKFEKLQPDAIVLTHAHPDHAWGLKNCLRPNGIDFAFMFSVVATALCRRFEATSQ